MLTCRAHDATPGVKFRAEVFPELQNVKRLFRQVRISLRAKEEMAVPAHTDTCH
jgi:hypothetical protein